MGKRFKKITETIRIKCFQPFFRKMCGWQQLEDRLSAIEYIINKGFDITQFPKATGLLRQCQTAGAEMMRIVCRTLDENGLTYWLDYGTLLGAVRHKGYIPWDDDIDIAMSREEFNKACKIIPAQMEKYGIEVASVSDERIFLCIWEAGLIMDIFPMDNVDADSVSSQEELGDKIIKYRKYYVKNKKSKSSEELLKKKCEVIGEPSKKNPLWYHNPEFIPDRKAFDDDMIFPVKELDFEGYTFKVPNKYHEYLTKIFGDYMSMPKGGVLHHQGGNGDKGITYNVVKYGTDIEAVREQLKKY